MLKISIEEALIKINTLTNIIHNIQPSKNKGDVGNYLEQKIGIKPSSDCLDCIDGEIKTFSLRKNKTNPILQPKETIAITMCDRDELKTKLFDNTRLYKKIQNIIFIPYFRKGMNVIFFPPIHLQIKNDMELLTKIKIDYNDIRKELIECNTIHSNIGNLIQCRTKGKGGNAVKTRAYYFKTLFIRTYLCDKIIYDDNIKQHIKTMS